jgi:hypothetical protein
VVGVEPCWNGFLSGHGGVGLASWIGLVGGSEMDRGGCD